MLVASFYSAGLLLGLVPGERVVQWADEHIARDAEVPPAMLDVSLTAPGDLTALRRALQPMADEQEAPAIVDAILDVVRRDLESGLRDIDDTATVFAQIRRFLTVSPEIDQSLDTFVDEFMLASAGVTGDRAAIERRARAWLAQFEGAEAALFSARPNHIVVCDRAVEAAAFVGALSRFVNSPSARATATRDPAEVWVLHTDDGEQVTLYLNDAALRAAETAFSPVPVARTCDADARPREATLVLDQRNHQAMGLIEAERAVSPR